MSTPTPPPTNPVQRVAHAFLDELETKFETVMGPLSSSLKDLLDRVRRQAHDDAGNVETQVGQDVDALRLAATDAVHNAGTPPQT